MKMISLKDAAEMLGIEPGTLQKWVQKQAIPCYRYPRPTSRPRFRQDEIESYIKARRVDARRKLRRVA